MRIKVSQLRKIIAEEVARVMLTEEEMMTNLASARKASVAKSVVAAVKGYAEKNGLKVFDNTSDPDVKLMLTGGQPRDDRGGSHVTRGEMSVMVLKVSGPNGLEARLSAQMGYDGGDMKFILGLSKGGKAAGASKTELGLDGPGDAATAVAEIGDFFGAGG